MVEINTHINNIYIHSLLDTIDDEAKDMVAKLLNPATDKEVKLALSSANILYAVRSLKKAIDKEYK